LSVALSDWFKRFTEHPSQLKKPYIPDKNTTDFFSHNSEHLSEAMLIAPVAQNKNVKALKEKINSIISDNFILDNEYSDESGVVKPIFTNSETGEQEYLFMMVPVIPKPAEK
jgi:hypothetical protein